MAAQTTRRFALPLKRPGINPILIKELRGRMRGPRAFLILTAFLLLLSVVAFFLYKSLEEMARFNSGPVPVSATVGVTMFLGIAFFEMFLVAFITPALTAGAISGERESLTYEMLLATPLRPTAILVGKMVASLSYVFLLIFAAVPMLSLVYIFGGVTVRDMAAALLVLAVTTLCFGMVGTFWSALLGRTSRATVTSYLTLLGFVLGPFVAWTAWQILARYTPPPALLYANPFAAMASVAQLGPEQGFGFMGGLSYALFALLTGGMGMMGGPPMPLNHPIWHWTLALYGLLTLLLTLATILLVRPAGRRRVTVPQALLAVALVAAYLGAMTLVFSAQDWHQIWRSPDGAQPGFRGEILPARAVPMMAEPAIEVQVEVTVVAEEPTPTPAPTATPGT